MDYQSDILILGTGIAGLSLALQIAEKRPDLKIYVLSKNTLYQTNTRFAQGGIAVVSNFYQDSFDQHIQDTLEAGRYLCKRDIVEKVVTTAPARIQDLEKWGVVFDKNVNGQWNLGREGGHSQNRILHHKDLTGWEIQQKLLLATQKHQNVFFFTHFQAIDLLIDEQRCIGVCALNKNEKHIDYFFAFITVLATGGSGQVFSFTSNPSEATGDGVAMAHRANVRISNMHYFQFHPTVLYEETKFQTQAFLISEAVRGYGAYLLNHKQERFTFLYSEKGELAPRDVVCDAIFKELQNSGEKYIFLDVRHISSSDFAKKFPTIQEKLIQLGLQSNKNLIPVLPAAHYQCGGISVDEYAQTNITNLYAIGECADTGLHGANRLASNSLLEALVFAYEASNKIIDNVSSISLSTNKHIKKSHDKKIIVSRSDLKDTKMELQNMMSLYYHTNNSIQTDSIKYFIKKYSEKISYIDYYDSFSIEVRNLLTIAPLILAKNLSNDE